MQNISILSPLQQLGCVELHNLLSKVNKHVKFYCKTPFSKFHENSNIHRKVIAQTHGQMLHAHILTCFSEVALFQWGCLQFVRIRSRYCSLKSIKYITFFIFKGHAPAHPTHACTRTDRQIREQLWNGQSYIQASVIVAA